MTKFDLDSKISGFIRSAMDNPALAAEASLDGKHFLRKRIFNAKTVLFEILSGIHTSLQSHLNDAYIERDYPLASASAFCQSRTGFDPEVVHKIYRKTAEEFAKCDDLAKWRGFRLHAVDGTKVRLYGSKANMDEYGSFGSPDACMAMLLTVFDIFNNNMEEALLKKGASSEADAALEAINSILSAESGDPAANLFIFDRGFPSAELIAELRRLGVKFLMRAKMNFSADFKEEPCDEEIELKDGAFVRHAAIVLGNGEIEHLLTNCGAEELPYEYLRVIYFLRWEIEEEFKWLKTALDLENISGRRPVVVQQDIWSRLIQANSIGAVKLKSDDRIDKKYGQLSASDLLPGSGAAKPAPKGETVKKPERRRGSKNKSPKGEVRRQTNRRQLAHMMLRGWIECLLDGAAERIAKILEVLARFPVYVEKGRKAERKAPKKMRFHDCCKSVWG
jgi:hypothetical protein